MGVDPTKARVANWNLTWGAHDLGGVDEVDPTGLKLKLKELKIGTYGDMVLDAKVVGLEDGAVITATVREVTRLRLEKLCPWFTTTTLTTPIPLMPLPGAGLYQYAQTLLMHPTDTPGATLNEDVELYKTVPVQSFLIKRDGVEWDEFMTIFRVFPDHAKLAAGTENPYGRIKGSS